MVQVTVRVIARRGPPPFNRDGGAVEKVDSREPRELREQENREKASKRVKNERFC